MDNTQTIIEWIIVLVILVSFLLWNIHRRKNNPVPPNQTDATQSILRDIRVAVILILICALVTACSSCEISRAVNSTWKITPMRGY